MSSCTDICNKPIRSCVCCPDILRYQVTGPIWLRYHDWVWWIRTVVYVSEAGQALLVNFTLICLLCHRSKPKVKYLKHDRNHSLNSTLQEYTVDIICSSKIIIELRSRETIPVLEQMICPRTKFQAYFRAKWRLLFIYIFWSFFLFYEVKLRSYEEPSKIFPRPLFSTWARGASENFKCRHGLLWLTSIHFILFWFSN